MPCEEQLQRALTDLSDGQWIEAGEIAQTLDYSSQPANFEPEDLALVVRMAIHCMALGVSYGRVFRRTSPSCATDATSCPLRV